MSPAPQSCPNQNMRGPTVSNSENLSLFLSYGGDGQMNNSSRVFTKAALKAQAERGSARAYERRVAEGFPDRITAELAKFIAEQDTAFLTTATADGATYMQDSRGQKVFIKVLYGRTSGPEER